MAKKQKINEGYRNLFDKLSESISKGLRLESLTITTTDKGQYENLGKFLETSKEFVNYKPESSTFGAGFSQYVGVQSTDTFGYNGTPGYFYGQNVPLKAESYMFRLSGDIGLLAFYSIVIDFISNLPDKEIFKVSSINFTIPCDQVSYKNDTEIQTAFENFKTFQQSDGEAGKKLATKLFAKGDYFQVGPPTSDVSMKLVTEPSLKGGQTLLIKLKVSSNAAIDFGQSLFSLGKQLNDISVVLGSLVSLVRKRTVVYKPCDFISTIENKVGQFNTIDLQSITPKKGKVILTKENEYVKRSLKGVSNKVTVFCKVNSEESKVMSSLIDSFAVSMSNVVWQFKQPIGQSNSGNAPPVLSSASGNAPPVLSSASASPTNVDSAEDRTGGDEVASATSGGSNADAPTRRGKKNTG